MGRVLAVTLPDLGNLYDSVPLISIDAPSAIPINALGTATMTGDGRVDSIHVVTPGSHYLVTPDVLISGPTDSSGKQATASLVYDSINDKITSISLVDSGKFYDTAPTITFSSPDSGIISAVANAAVESGQVISLTLTNQGAGYYSAPTISLSAPTGLPNNYRAYAAAIMDNADSNNSVSHIQMISQGKFYTGIATVTMDSSTGTSADFKAQLTPILNFATKRMIRVDVVNSGKYYDSTNPPTIRFSEPPEQRFDVGEKVTQQLSTTVMHGEVSNYNKETRTLSVIHAGAADGQFHQFFPDSDSDGFLVGTKNANRFEILSVTEVNKISEIEQNEDFAATSSNVLLDFLDFSETNPFGDPGD